MAQYSWRKDWQKLEDRGCYKMYSNGSYICNHNAGDPACRGKDGKGCLPYSMALLYPLPEVMAAKKWFYCPAARKCVKNWDDCLGDTDVIRNLAAAEIHDPENLDNDAGITLGKKGSSPAVVDSGGGFQPLSVQILGGARIFGGSLVRVIASTVLFTVQSPPSRCTRVLNPMLDKYEKLHLVATLVCGDGRITVSLPPEYSAKGHEGHTFDAMLSLSYLRYVPREVKGLVSLCTALSSGWRCLKTQDPAASEAYYHSLSFPGGKRLCFLSGTISHKNPLPAGSSTLVAKVDQECIGSLNHYRIAANVRIDGIQHWTGAGEPPFQLVLRDSKLLLDITTSGAHLCKGKILSLSLDGVAIPAKGGTSELISESDVGEVVNLESTTMSHVTRSAVLSSSTTQPPKPDPGAQTELLIQMGETDHDALQQCQGQLQRQNEQMRALFNKGLNDLDSEGGGDQSGMESLQHLLAPRGPAPTEALAGDVATRDLGELDRSSGNIKELRKQCTNMIKALELREENSDLLAAVEKNASAKAEGSSASPVDAQRLIAGPSAETVNQAFARSSIITHAHQAVLGDDITARFCALHGVATFTSLPATKADSRREVVAHLDPNFRDAETGIPYCFPMQTRVFFAGVVKSESSSIERLVAIRLEPHGRLVVLGNEPKDIKIRLDNIAYQPLMKANTAPGSCAPYCFPTGLLDQTELGVAGCVKYCEPPQDVQLPDYSRKPSPCKCAIIKRLSCFLHEGSDLTTCGQFKMLMNTRSTDRNINPAACEQICAGQVSAF